MNTVQLLHTQEHVQNLHTKLFTKGRENLMTYGSVLKNVRLKAGISQEIMAEKMFISRSTVSRLENDRLKLTVEDAVRWGQVTQATEVVAALLCGVDLVLISQLITSLVGDL